MQATAIGYKLIKKLKDERFDEESLHQYDLLVQFGVRDLQISIIDASDNRVLFFEDYVLGDISSHEELLELFKTLFESHPVLPAGFWKSVSVSLKNNKYVQVPASLFIEDAAPEYLRFNAQFDSEKEEVIYCRNSRIDAFCIFAVYTDLLDWLKSLYSNTKLTVLHQSSALIEGVMAYAGTTDTGKLYIYVDRFKLHITSVNKGKLIYYNQFGIKQFSDYVKYIMLVLKGLGMDQQKSEIVLWGYVGKNSPHYHEFVKYIRNISFGTRPASLKFGYIFDEMQEHHFFDLFSAYLLNK